MPKRLFSFFMIAIFLLACNILTIPSPPTIPASTFPTPSSTGTIVPPPPVSRTESPFNISWDDRSLFRQNLTSSAQDILEGLPEASIYHIALSFSDPPTHISGIEEVRYTNQEAIALTEVDFAIFSEILGGSIVINNLTLDNQPVMSTHQTGIMRVPLFTPLLPGKSVIIHMEFDVIVPTLGGDFYYGIFGFNNDILSLAHAYPTILVYNEQGWNNQLPDLDGDPLFSDASFYLVSVDAPANLVLVASGKEVESSAVEGRQRALYANGPARDFYLAASSSFVSQSETIGELTVNNYSSGSLGNTSQTTINIAGTAIADFSQRYAPYPYSEFDIVPIVTSASGVEFPGMTSIADNVFNNPGYLEIVVTHEIGHQWFYNMVGNSTQGQPWLDESMAEFVTWQYFLDQYGIQGAQACQDELQQIWDTVDDENIPIGLPVSAYTSNAYVAIVYGRGPIFLLTLRDRMGKEAFDLFIKEYTHRYEWGIATSADFKQVAEQTCNCDLTVVFDEWVNP